MVPFIMMFSIIFALGAGAGCASDSPDTDGLSDTQDAGPAAAGAADAGLLPSPIDSGSMAPQDASPNASGALMDSATSDAATAMDATAPTDAATPDGQAVPPSTGMNCLQGSGDFSKAGPYTVKTKVVTIGSSGEFTIYVPQPLEEKCPHPMVAWGNGTTVPGGTAYRHFNERLATWGIVTIASHDDGTANSGPRIGDGSFHRAAIDYLLQQNQDSSSEFFGKISGKAGVSGHSQGGAGGDRASMHPNVKANGNVQGSFGSAPRNVAFLCLTGTEDIATEGCLTAVNGTSMPAMYASFDGMSHTATLSARSAGTQQYARLLSAWFRCFLADDGTACALFMGGADCPLCNEPGWDEIFAKNY